MFGPTFIRPEILLKQKVVLDYQKQKLKKKILNKKNWLDPQKIQRTKKFFEQDFIESFLDSKFGFSYLFWADFQATA